MTNPTKLSITALDFDQIRQSLREFLSSQTKFSDYNFEGSALSVILNTLSANTHYLGYYLNMVANEMFLDSADLRASVVSLAKQLNYTPRSRNAATAIVDFVVTPTGVSPATLIAEKFTKFTTTINSKSYTFVTDEAHTSDYNISTGKYEFIDITLREGIPYTFRYTADTTIPNQRFIIPNENVDTRTITVRVQNSVTDTTVAVYSLANNINVITDIDKVFFLQEAEDLQYEVYFGDGVVGKAIENGNLIIIEYLACSADEPNLASIFSSAQSIGGFGNIAVTTTTSAYGGAEREDLESIRFNAPKNYEAQDRAVTAADYRTILTRDYPNIDSLSIWGGEDNVPPIYGKVFISLKPATGFVITETVKSTIIADILKSKNILTVIPTIIDPDYIFLTIAANVKYNPSLTTLTSDAIKAIVQNTISSFAINQVSKFNLLFKYSKFVTAIDVSNTSISSNITTITMQKRITPIIGTTQAFDVIYNSGNPLIPGTVVSSKFVSAALGFQVNTGETHNIIDDGEGNLHIVKYVGAKATVVKTNAGTVDYVNGLVKITALNPTSIVEPVTYIRIFAKPVQADITPQRNNIIIIDNADVTVSMTTSSN